MLLDIRLENSFFMNMESFQLVLFGRDEGNGDMREKGKSFDGFVDQVVTYFCFFLQKTLKNPPSDWSSVRYRMISRERMGKSENSVEKALVANLEDHLLLLASFPFSPTLRAKDVELSFRSIGRCHCNANRSSKSE